MRWLMASVGGVVVLLLTFPVLAAGSSDGPGECTSAVGVRTLGNSETCDTGGVAVSLPAALLVFALIAWGWKRLHDGRTRAEDQGMTPGPGAPKTPGSHL